MVRSPPFRHLGGLPHRPDAFHLRLPFDFPSLKMTCDSLLRAHPPASIFPQSPLKWLLLSSVLHQGQTLFAASSVGHVAGVLPSKAERLGAPVLAGTARVS